MTGYRRRDLLERHMWRSNLGLSPDVAEDAALFICGQAADQDDARDLLAVVGLVHPDGPARVDPRVTLPRNAPKPDAHRKRARAR